MNKKFVSFVIMASIMFTSASPAFAKNFASKQNVALNHKWTVTFNQKVSINEAFEGVYIEDNNGSKIETRIDFSDDNTKMIVTPTDGYKPNTTYTLNVGGVCNEQGKALSDNAAMQFTTANAAQAGSFDITSIAANKNQGTEITNLDPDSSFGITFTKNVDPSTLGNVTVTDKDGNKANIDVYAVGNTISIDANNDLKDDTKTITVPRNAFKCNDTYTINLNGIKSSDGQDIATKTYSFTTRDYNLNPTINGICNDDYFAYASQYSQQLFNPVDPATGYVKVGLSPAHDDNGSIVYDSQKTWNGMLIPKFQPDGHWNKYANLQSRNQYDLQIEFQNEYKKIAAKNSDYDSKRLISFNSDVFFDMNDNIFDLYLNHGTELESPTFTTSIYNDPSLDTYSFQRLDNATHPRSAVMGNIQKVQHAQIFIGIPQEQGVQKNLQKLYLYQHLVSIFGYDYADELENYMLQQEYALNSVRDTLQTTQIGNIKVWVQDGQFLFKY